MSIVAFLGLQRGEAGALPERPQWRSPSDAAFAQIGSARFVDAGPISSNRPTPPPAAWAPPAEIARSAPAVEVRSVHVLVWLPPAEIAALADDDIAAAPLQPSPIWAPPLEIAPAATVVEGRSAAGNDTLVWLPPAEIAAPAVVLPVAPIVWALPAEIAPAAAAPNPRLVQGVALVWLPPKEISRRAGRADRV
ncbi:MULTISPECIES: hypothetical protein [Methylosinus]|nr:MULTISPECIES: hypothetical protein [Methylosinus]